MQDSEKLASALQTLESIDCAALAEASGWRQRSDGRISPLNWLRAVVGCGLSPSVSLRVLAMGLFALSDEDVSKQAVSGRLEAGARLLGHALAAALELRIAQRPRRLGRFKRVLIQDSTAVPLPDRMAAFFPYRLDPNSTTATLRIQAVYDLMEGRYAGFHLHAHAQPDQKRSADIAGMAGAGDLIVRDLGYYNHRAFRGIERCGARHLSKLHGQSVLKELCGGRIDLLDKLQRRGSLDQIVLLGGGRGEKPLKLRLVALRLPAPVAAERRRKLRRDNPKVSRRTLQLQHWNLFLTNATPQELPAEQIESLYRLRWTIEILFKSWKSGLNLRRLPPRASAGLIANLLLATLLRCALVQHLAIPWLQGSDQEKASAYKIATIETMLRWTLANSRLHPEDLRRAIRKYTLYEPSKRQSLPELLDQLAPIA